MKTCNIIAVKAYIVELSWQVGGAVWGDNKEERGRIQFPRWKRNGLGLEFVLPGNMTNIYVMESEREGEREHCVNHSFTYLLSHFTTRNPKFLNNCARMSAVIPQLRVTNWVVERYCTFKMHRPIWVSESNGCSLDTHTHTHTEPYLDSRTTIRRNYRGVRSLTIFYRIWMIDCSKQIYKLHIYIYVRRKREKIDITC